MLRKVIATGMAVSAMNMAFAQDSTKMLVVTGSADVYYKYDFGKTKANNLTSFTHTHNAFALGTAGIRLEYQTNKTDMVADMGFGNRAKEFSYNDKGITAAVKQLYISYLPTNWLKITAGSWATHIGYESADAYANHNYSMSYMFSYGPFFHTGIKAVATVKNNGFMAGITNPPDFKYMPDDVINKKWMIAQYSFTPGDGFKLYLNYAGGTNIDTSKSHQVDMVLTSQISDKFNMAFNGTITTIKDYIMKDIYSDYKSWWGAALYMNYALTSHISLALRNEYFSDKNQLKVYSTQPYGGNIFASTLSVNIKVDNLLLIPEFRIDKANHAVFTNNGNAAATDKYILLAAVYQF